MGEIAADERGLAAGKESESEEEETSPIEEVRLTVPPGDDPTLPVWTFRMWSIGLLSCALMSFLNQFFSYRTEPLIVTQITVQVASLPMGHFLARVLPRRKFRTPAVLGGGEWSLNPGPFNMKEHVLISIFANAGYAFGNGNAYAVMIVDIIRAFYRRSISFLAAWLLITTTQPNQIDLGAWVRVGRSDAQVRGGAGAHVVAEYARPGLALPASMASTVKVHNVSLQASERDIKEFFCFSGDIVHVQMQSGDERSQFAYITFRDEQEAERAMLLTGATIVDMAVIITPATNYQLPAAVLADLESKNPSGIGSALRKAEDVVGFMLAKGFILGKDAVEKAKTFDETHQLTSTATAKVSSIDKSLGLSEKISTSTIVVNEKMKEMDEKYQVAEKTKSALVAAEQTVSTAGSAIMSNRYILTGAAWVTGAYNKVATTANDAYNKERAMAEQDGERAKSHLHESSEEAGQESNRQEGDPAKVAVSENTETGQMADQEGECPKTNMPEDTEMGKDEQKNQDGEIAKAQTQENTEITAEEHKHREAALPKASTPESLLMAEQTEQEHKHPDTEVANTNIPGSPVTIPVCMATDDGNSSNSPKKPGPAQ